MVPSIRPLPTGSAVRLVQGVRVAAAVPLLVNVVTGSFVGRPFFKWVVFLLVHPLLVWYALGIRLSPGQQLWVSAGPTLHSLGGIYDLYKQWWWLDHVTHLLSATSIAALVYVLVCVYDRRDHTRSLSVWVISGIVLMSVTVVGGLWEVYEVRSAVLTVYGAEDTVKDLFFDVVSGLLVSVLGPRYLRESIEDACHRFGLGTPRPMAN